MSIEIVLMAAGQSQRMGRAKQLLPYAGTSLLRHAAETALRSRTASVSVVVGAAARTMREELEGLAVNIVANPEWEQGMGTTIHAGVSLLRDRVEITGVILTLADQPLLTAETYNRLIAAHLASGLPVVASAYSGTVGVPVLFGRPLFDALLALPPDKGCKGLILENAGKSMRLPCPEAAVDIDNPSDYEFLLGRSALGPSAD